MTHTESSSSETEKIKGLTITEIAKAAEKPGGLGWKEIIKEAWKRDSLTNKEPYELLMWFEGIAEASVSERRLGFDVKQLEEFWDDANDLPLSPNAENALLGIADKIHNDKSEYVTKSNILYEALLLFSEWRGLGVPLEKLKSLCKSEDDPDTAVEEVVAMLNNELKELDTVGPKFTIEISKVHQISKPSVQLKIAKLVPIEPTDSQIEELISNG